MPFLSIIIPVYKVEKYLKQCVDSILNQTFKDIEIILVDDGSPDNCPKICDEYKNIDTRVKVIHKLNEGVSVARNIGLQSACGQYVTFVDSDDYWNNEHCLNEIVKQLESRPDFIIFGMSKYYQQDKRLIKQPIFYTEEIIKSDNKIEIFNYLSKNGIFPGAVWDKLIRRDILIKNNIQFNSNLISSEDIDFVLNLILYSKKIKCSNTNMYVYRQQREESVTNNIRTKNVRDLFFTITQWQERIIELKDRELENTIYPLLAYEYSILIALLPKVKSELSKEFQDDINKYSWLLQYDLNPKVKKVNFVYKVLGMRGISFVLMFMLKLREHKFIRRKK